MPRARASSRTGPRPIDCIKPQQRGGDAQAQVIVGLDYADDGNVPIDLVQAYRWLTIASASETPGEDFTDVLELREHLKTRLTADQLVEARRMVLEGQRDISSEPSQ